MSSILQNEKKDLIDKFKSDSDFRKRITQIAEENINNKIEDNKLNFDPSFNDDFAKQDLRKLFEYSNSINKQEERKSKGFFSRISDKLFGVNEPKTIENSRDISAILDLITSANTSLLASKNSTNTYAKINQNAESERAPRPLNELEAEKVKPALERQFAQKDLKPNLGKHTEKIAAERQEKQNSKDVFSIG